MMAYYNIFCIAILLFSYLRIELLHMQNERKEKERQTGKPQKNIRERVGKKPVKENALSISSDKITTNGPQPLHLPPPFTCPDATCPIPFACRRLLVCFFSPSFPSETSSVDPGARRNLFQQQRFQPPPVQHKVYLSLRYVVSTMPID